MLRSLRWRLFFGGAAAMLAAVIVAWLFMGLLFTRHLERRLADEMERDGVRLVAALAAPPGAPVDLQSALSDPRLFTPAGGFYWQVRGAGRDDRSRSLWDQEIAVAADAPTSDWRLRIARGPYEPRVVILERRVRPDAAGGSAVVQLAQDAAVLGDARREFGIELGAFLFVLWAFLTGAAWLQVLLGLKPLAEVRKGVEALAADPAARLASPRLDDLKPLTDTINALLSARESELDRARGRAADLAHGLKTPLAALKAQSQRLRDADYVEAADALDRAIGTMSAVIEGQLARGRIAHSSGQTSDARDVVEHLISVLEQTAQGERLVFTNAIDEAFRFPTSPDAAMEMLGPLMENATRFARRQVVVSAVAQGGRLAISVDDDGPGIAATQLAAAFDRGARLDETSAGHGLGLAIARDLAAASNGELSLTRSIYGGLSARISWQAPTAK